MSINVSTGQRLDIVKFPGLLEKERERKEERVVQRRSWDSPNLELRSVQWINAIHSSSCNKKPIHITLLITSSGLV